MTMRKLFLVLVIAISIASCKKTKFDPEGPTDVRVKNLYTVALTDVVVNTSGGTNSMGSVLPNGVSEYFRFDKAFNIAEISAKINGVQFSTGTVDYNALTYIGQAKITYEVTVEGNKLKITNCSLDAPLD